LKTFDAIYLGAVGDPRIPDDVTLHGLLLPIKFGFDLYVGLRPSISFLESDLLLRTSPKARLTLWWSGRYRRRVFECGRDRRRPGSRIGPSERSLHTKGIERIIAFAFEYARKEGRKRLPRSPNRMPSDTEWSSGTGFLKKWASHYPEDPNGIKT